MLSISPIYASILIGFIIFLAYRVTTFRQTEAIGLGEATSSDAMKCAIRAHGNAVENIPVGIILLLLLELNHLNPWLLHAFGLVLVVSRFMHAWGISRSSGATKGRFYGTLFTWLVLLIMVVVNVWVVFSPV